MHQYQEFRYNKYRYPALSYVKCKLNDKKNSKKYSYYREKSANIKPDFFPRKIK
jgi:hypothetical protein